MGLFHYLWSRTASSNATADAQINFAEGQAPSSVNDSCRALMASAAGFRDDIAGAIITGGTSTAYTVASYQVFDTLAHMANQVIAFTPHTTNGATVTLNVDGLGAKPLRSSTAVELLAGTLIAGTPYTALYNNSDAVWYLHGFYGNPYNVPLAGGMDFWGTTVPNSAFAFPAGQAISRTTYSTLFTIMSTTYGIGDGSTTFNLPDKTGRASFMKEASATRLTTAGGGIDGATMGSAAGAQTQIIVTANLPAYTPTGTVTLNTLGLKTRAGNATTSNDGNSLFEGNSAQTLSNPNNGPYVSSSLTFAGVAQGGTSTAVKTTPPGIICNYIIRII